MKSGLKLYNTLSRKIEVFEPIKAPFVGMYLCGPTVYGDAHLGHSRPAVTFDVLFRYLKYCGYKVRFVRNITDVGHLENDADEGEDKIAKKARLEQLEPMEVAQYYTDRYHKNLEQLNVLPPSIEPRASGHILEQIELVQQILAQGLAYESNGSVYFDVHKYNQKGSYGKLSGRVLEDLISSGEDRALDGQEEKRNKEDFALWKRADPVHIMRWNSPWGEGFPGWHLECTAMSSKYLGTTFDIHAGGMDLMFPHHECEIAQSNAAHNHDPAKYWVHNNMITINGQKMGKSLGNFITLDEIFSGSNKVLEQAYNPMTVRFFILQAHYRSTLDFGNEALQAAEKGLARFLKGVDTINQLKAGEATSEFNVAEFETRAFEFLNDDLSTPRLIATIYEAIHFANLVVAGKASISAIDLKQLQTLINTLVFDILGLKAEEHSQQAATAGLVEFLLKLRSEAKANKDYAKSDQIRDELVALGIQIMDSKSGTTWTFA